MNRCPIPFRRRKRSRMRKTIFLLLALFFCLSAAHASEYTLSVSSSDAPYTGIWSFSSDQQWRYILQTDIQLSENQARSAGFAGIHVEEGRLPAGTTLTVSQLESIFPDANNLFGVPKLKPSLSLFGLTGKWFYGNDDKLYYQHNDQSVILSKDEVFAQLRTEAPPDTNEKIIYLTIDDSPTSYTMDLLAVLDDLDVKATFFVVGSYVRTRPVFLRAIYEQGHTIANHSYTHQESMLKKNFSTCLSEFKRTGEEVSKALGFPLPMPIIRIPYGSGILTNDMLDRLQREGYYWIDWNALNGDTESQIQSDVAALDRAITTAGRYDGSIVMLVHDGKKRTIRILPELVKHFREQGYEFRVLDVSVPKIDGVRAGFPK